MHPGSDTSTLRCSLDEGVELEKISQLLGHTTTKITEKIYLHWRARHLRDAAERVQVGKKE